MMALQVSPLPLASEIDPASSGTLLRLPDPSSFAVPLLDAITIEHGPADLLGRFFLQADRAVRDRGMRLAFSNDFSLLARINEANRDSWYPLAPAFDLSGGANVDNAYFFIVYDEEEIVATQVGRVHDMPDGLSEHCRSLRLMYDDPARAPAGTSCALSGDARRIGEDIRGRVVFSGGTWCKPGKARGRGLASVLARISRCYALSRFGTAWTVSTVRKTYVTGGLMRAYGYTKHAFEFQWQSGASQGGPTTPDNPAAIIWMDRAELESDIVSYVNEFNRRPQAAE